MDDIHHLTGSPAEAGVVQLDDALLDACGPKLRAELLIEAAMLVQAFAPEGHREELFAMAANLASHAREEDVDGARARRLACALRCLARGAEL